MTITDEWVQRTNRKLDTKARLRERLKGIIYFENDFVMQAFNFWDLHNFFEKYILMFRFLTKLVHTDENEMWDKAKHSVHIYLQYLKTNLLYKREKKSIRFFSQVTSTEIILYTYWMFRIKSKTLK